LEKPMAFFANKHLFVKFAGKC
jgi:hypothetical protein